jgi:tight adherence protein B
MMLVLVGCLAFLSVALLAAVAAQGSSRFMTRYRSSFMDQARLNLADMFLFVNEGSLFMAYALALFGVPLLLWLLTGGWFLPVIALVLLAIVPRRAYVWLRQRRINKIQQQLPDGLMMLSSSLRAGVGFNPALETLAKDGIPPLAQELSLILREQHMGVRTEQALENFATRVPLADVKLFVAAVCISREVGGNLAETLATLAETLRRKLMMEGKVKALTSQGKLQGVVMAMLPVGIGGYLYFMYPETMGGLLHEPIGWGLIAVCSILEYIGYKFCQKIMTIDI